MDNNKLLFSHLPKLNQKRQYLCPDCNLGMIAFRCQDKVVYKCYACEGVWFNKGGFATFKKTLDHLDLNKIHHIYKPPKDDQLNISTCPKCKIPLDEQAYSYKSDISIKKCSHCFGFWLPIYDFLTLVQNSKFSQNIKEEATEIANNVTTLMKLKKSSSQKFTLTSFYGRNSKWLFLLTPLALIAIIISPLIMITNYLMSKYLNKSD